ncbi:MAG TPA: YfhO family protein, partial [Anaerolineae bacterium]
YYPGWRAWVDDREVDVLRADSLFRAVALSGGAHRVRLLYDPASFKIGAGLFMLTALALVAWGVRRRKK